VYIALIGVPLLGALIAFAFPSQAHRPKVLPITAALHFLLTLLAIADLDHAAKGVYLELDGFGSVVLAVISSLFFVCALYAPVYLAQREDRPNRAFVACLLLFLSMNTAVVLAQHLGLLWVAVEATTLAAAPLIYFNRNARSIEATWKYLVIGSVGIALALLGSLFLAYSVFMERRETSLLFDVLLANPDGFSPPWLRAAFVFLVVGYGTKMGLAPMHTWKPDAYGEAPGIVGALLAGGTASSAFLALMRVYRVVDAGGQGPFARSVLVFLGMASLAVAAVFLVRQRDLKRMLAYSSVEHMGLLVLGIGLGGVGTYGSILHIANSGLTKGVLFLSAANLNRAFGSRNVQTVRGAFRRAPVSAALFLAGFFSATGSPPFGPFVSELAIVRAAFGGGHLVVGALLLALLAITFMGMATTVLAAVQGEPATSPVDAPQTYRDTFFSTAPIMACLLVVLMLGLAIPEPVAAVLARATAQIEGAP